MNSKLYLRHDVYTLDDAKVMALVYKYKAEGYGVFWAVVERLTAEPTHRVDKDMLAMQTAMKLCAVRPAKVAEIIRHAVELGLFKESDGLIYNERVDRQCEQVEQYSKQQSENVRKRWERRHAEHAQTQDDAPDAPSDAPANPSRKDIFNDVLAKYHALCPSLPKVRTTTDARITHACTFASNFTPDEIEEGFKKAEASDFLKHGNNTWNGANFDWLINKNNFAKVLENNYVNSTPSRRSSVCNDAQTINDGGNGNGGFDL